MQVSHESHLTQPSLSTLITFIKLFFSKKGKIIYHFYSTEMKKKTVNGGKLYIS